MKQTVICAAFVASLEVLLVAGILLTSPRLMSHHTQSSVQLGGSVAGASSEVPVATQERIVTTYGKLPLSFEANRGQSDRRVKFIARGGGYTMFLTATETVLSIQKPLPVGIKLLAANPAPRVEGLGEQQGESNYFIGNDPAKWRTHVPHYSRVRYRNVYRGVDLVYYGNQQQIEHDFVVAPGADPRQIRFAVRGADRVELDNRGELVIHLGNGEMRLRKPRIYQEEGEVRKEVLGGYTLTAGNLVGFALGPYDRTRPLVIDPILSYSTYLGGSDFDRGLAPAVDRNGNVYVTGQTSSTNFPTTNSLQPVPGGGQDVFVTKLNAGGSAIVYSVYLGGSGDDSGFGIAVDDTGNAYVSGRTASTNFPTASPLQAAYGGGPTDAFVVKLNTAGSALVYSTYLGGSGQDNALDLRLDAAGSAYVAGRTSSTNFPTANSLQSGNAGDFDVFVSKLNPAGSALVYSTYLGGSANEGLTALAVDRGGNAYVSAGTSSTDFPTINALQPTYGGGPMDAFVAKLNAAGSALIYSTYLGGSGNEMNPSVAVDLSGNAYVAGRTFSTDFPTANPLQPARAGASDAFVSKLNAAGSALIYSTYLGGSGDENIFGIASDAAGNAYVSGWTSSPDLPTANPLQPAYGGGISDAFVAKLNATGPVLVYSTYLGGSGEDKGDFIVVDASGSAYVTGWTASTDFPTANPLQNTNGGGAFDVFVAKISEVLTGNVFHFAQAGGGGGFSTSIALTNPSTNTSVSGTVSFFANDGRPLTTVVANAVVPVVIQPSRTTILATGTQGSTMSGYVRVSLTSPVFANATYTLPGFPSLSVRPSAVGSVLLASISRDAEGIEHGIALANTSSASARVNLSLMDSSGNELFSSLVFLAPGEQVSRFLSELMPGIPSRFAGTLRIGAAPAAILFTQSPIILAATVVEFRRNQLRSDATPASTLKGAPTRKVMGIFRETFHARSTAHIRCRPRRVWNPFRCGEAYLRPTL